ncbi:MFS transporter [Halomarina ordinaria]|uniref:Nitrate/nitrite transporter n=1 Tax=Halomarina ordinaria TaxID=3033939 RepID=A0ABD5UCS6_9EURY|nr:MFS transporter [Halomarina sp. PSRA2]
MDVFASVGREARALWGGGRGTSLVTIAVGWGMLNGTRMTFPVLLPYLRDAFDLGLAVAGLLVSVLWLGSAVGQLPGGIVADRYSERLVMSASTFAVAAALAVVAVAPTPVVLFAATGLVGLGQSLYPIARITSLSHIYPDRIGSALGVTMATGDLGQTVLPPVVGVLAGVLAWQAGLVALIPLFVATGVAIWVVLPVQDRSARSNGLPLAESARGVAVQLRRPNMAFMVFILFLYIFVWQSFTGLYPTYLVQEKGLSSAVVGVLFSLFFALGVVVKPLSGAAYDRVGMRWSLVLVLVGPTVGFALLPSVDGFWPLAAVTGLVSTMLGSGAVTQSFLSDAFPRELRGTGLGTVRTTAATLGATGPVLFGTVADAGYFDEGYLVLAALMAGTALLAFLSPRS